MREGRFVLFPGAILCLVLLICPVRGFGQNFSLVIQQSSGSAQAIGNGANVTVAAQGVNIPLQLTLIVTYLGQTSMTLGNPNLVGTSDFKMTANGLSSTLQTGTSASYSIVYTPGTSNQESSLLTMPFTEAGATITTASGTTTGPSTNGYISLALTGTAPGYILSYLLPPLSNAVVIGNAGTIQFPPTQVGSTTTATLQITNNGSAIGPISNVLISGSAFATRSLPVLPGSITAGQTLQIPIVYTPLAAENDTGTIQIVLPSQTITINLAGTGTPGSQVAAYSYSYTAGSSTSSVAPGGTVFFSPTQVGQNSSTTFTVTNSGTVSETISGIFIGQGSGVFSLSGLPQFPVTIAPNASVSFPIAFTPTATGSSGGTLQLDGVQFALSGAGNPPSALPAYSFTGASGTQSPLQQPGIGLNLASPYPLAISGTLTMTVSPDVFAADPAIQFSTGGRTVAFTIAANTTSAVFANGNSTIKFQTGSTAGTIAFVPSFQTAAGGVPLTPASPQTLNLVVPPVAPVLIGAQITGQSAAGITIAISGASNTESLTQLSFAFTPRPNFNLSGTTFTVPISSVASAWFQSAAAQSFGGQFIATVPFTLTSSVTSLTTPASAIGSITITATNSQGTSAPVTISLQ